MARKVVVSSKEPGNPKTTQYRYMEHDRSSAEEILAFNMRSHFLLASSNPFVRNYFKTGTCKRMYRSIKK